MTTMVFPMKIIYIYMVVSWNRGTPKTSILVGFSLINHPFLGYPHLWKPPNGGTQKCLLCFMENASKITTMSGRPFPILGHLQSGINVWSVEWFPSIQKFGYMNYHEKLGSKWFLSWARNQHAIPKESIKQFRGFTMIFRRRFFGISAYLSNHSERMNGYTGLSKRVSKNLWGDEQPLDSIGARIEEK